MLQSEQAVFTHAGEGQGNLVCSLHSEQAVFAQAVEDQGHFV